MTTPGHNLVVVHPLVLLSAVDHYSRVTSQTPNQRVVGVLLGSTYKGRVEVTNSYAVPFEEDTKNSAIWFLDHNYHETMWAMMRKVNANEKILGWYSTGPKIRTADLDIHELFRRYHSNPIFVIIDVNPSEVGIPTKAYISKEEVTEENKVENRFQHIPSIIGALEAEEVGVEHLLRDVKDTNISTLANRINDKLVSLKSLIARLQDMNTYLKNVINGKVPINNTIMKEIQEMFNLIPNLNDPELTKAFMVKTNDNMVAVYLASLIRSITAMHDLINNKLEFRAAEGLTKDGAKEEKPKNGKDEKGEEKKAGEKDESKSDKK
jgi:26S proteasome regulatory subunit N8